MLRAQDGNKVGRNSPAENGMLNVIISGSDPDLLAEDDMVCITVHSAACVQLS